MPRIRYIFHSELAKTPEDYVPKILQKLRELGRLVGASLSFTSVTRKSTISSPLRPTRCQHKPNFTSSFASCQPDVRLESRLLNTHPLRTYLFPQWLLTAVLLQKELLGARGAGGDFTGALSPQLVTHSCLCKPDITKKNVHKANY